MADEIRIVKHAAAQHNVVFVLGHAHAVLPKDTKIWQLPRRLILEMPYKVAAGICPTCHRSPHCLYLPESWLRYMCTALHQSIMSSRL